MKAAIFFISMGLFSLTLLGHGDAQMKVHLEEKSTENPYIADLSFEEGMSISLTSNIESNCGGDYTLENITGRIQLNFGTVMSCRTEDMVILFDPQDTEKFYRGEPVSVRVVRNKMDPDPDMFEAVAQITFRKAFGGC